MPDYFPEWLNQNSLESGAGADYRVEQEGQLRFERYPRTFNQISTRSGFDGFSKCRKWQLNIRFDNRDVICLVVRSLSKRHDTLTPSAQHNTDHLRPRNVHTPYRVPLLPTTYCPREYSYSIHTAYSSVSWRFMNHTNKLDLGRVMDGRSGIFTWPGLGRPSGQSPCANPSHFSARTVQCPIPDTVIGASVVDLHLVALQPDWDTAGAHLSFVILSVTQYEYGVVINWIAFDTPPIVANCRTISELWKRDPNPWFCGLTYVYLGKYSVRNSVLHLSIHPQLPRVGVGVQSAVVESECEVLCILCTE